MSDKKFCTNPDCDYGPEHEDDYLRLRRARAEAYDQIRGGMCLNCINDATMDDGDFDNTMGFAP